MTDLTPLAEQCGATVYRHRTSPHEAAIAFGPEAWERFCAALAARPAAPALSDERLHHIWMNEAGANVSWKDMLAIRDAIVRHLSASAVPEVTEQPKLHWCAQCGEGVLAGMPCRGKSATRPQGCVAEIYATHAPSAPDTPAMVMLTEEEIEQAWYEAARTFRQHKWSIRGQQLTAADSESWHEAIAIQRAFATKNGKAVKEHHE